jgi:hypothetical protein
MTCRNKAISAGAVTAPPYRIATARPAFPAWPAVMIPRGRDDAPAAEECALQDKAGAVGALDGLGDLRVGGVDQLAHLSAEGSLPAGQDIDTGIDSRAGGVCHGASSRPAPPRTSRPHALARRESMAHDSGEHVNAAHLTGVIRQP